MDEMNVIIAGAGIAGLTCSIALARHKRVKVTILERFPDIGPVGNGIQVPCNAAHVMRKLGLLNQMLKKAGGPATATPSMNYSDGSVLLTRDFTRCEEWYGAPWLLIHRADYMKILYEEARALGVQVKFGCEIQEVDFEAPWVKLASGEIHTADVIIGSDGTSFQPMRRLKSTIRSALHPSIRPRRTESFAYRAMFPITQLTSPTLQHILNPSACLFWLGPRTQIVLYALRGGQVFNLVVVVSDPPFNARCKEGDALALLRERLSDCDPAVRELMDAAQELVCFPLLELEDLPFWTRGHVTLMGDAAHPTLPHLGQGAAMCVEDGLVLGNLLGRMAERVNSGSSRGTLKSGIPAVLESYESIRHARTTRIVSQSRLAGIYSELPRGPAQRARDAEALDYDERSCISNWPWIDSRWNRELLAYRAGDVAEREFERLVDEGALDEVHGDRDESRALTRRCSAPGVVMDKSWSQVVLDRVLRLKDSCAFM
ncbi:Aromatic-ring hydroxylase-like protein [Tolypocladium paradoxum]|uniref:Aromatic-ring hydroxylase-like protein n=1 Tax=Tolypocladium paradoxum TaxID=94208 RepID=A0A2S4L595_9HYPO|nr:Aromatic-ring hydroxylase-like protein [Tolypocladium paradoxum]